MEDFWDFPLGTKGYLFLDFIELFESPMLFSDFDTQLRDIMVAFRTLFPRDPLPAHLNVIIRYYDEIPTSSQLYYIMQRCECDMCVQFIALCE